MTDFLLVAPVLVPLAGAVVLVAAWGRARIAGWVAMATSLVVLGLAAYTLLLVQRDGIQATNLGDWPGPFGIVLVADLFSAATVVAATLAAVASLAVVMLSQDVAQRKYILPFMLFLLAGVNGAFMTGDIFNLFVFFEVTLLASYALMAIGAGRIQTEAAFKYVVINVIGSTFLLVGIGLLYGELGTLNMAHLSIRASTAENGDVVTAVGALLMAAFAIKAALIPFHFWLPGAYAQLPSGVAVFFGAVLTKVGVYSMIRVFTLVIGHDHEFIQPALLTMAGLSIVFGALGAIAQRDIRSVLTWDIISQVGYMIMGLALFTSASVGAAIFFMLQYIPVKAALFSVAAAVERLRGTGSLGKSGRIGEGVSRSGRSLRRAGNVAGGDSALQRVLGKAGHTGGGAQSGQHRRLRDGRGGAGGESVDVVRDVQDMAVGVLGQGYGRRGRGDGGFDGLRIRRSYRGGCFGDGGAGGGGGRSARHNVGGGAAAMLDTHEYIDAVNPALIE